MEGATLFEKDNMTLEEIKTAVRAGQTVIYKTPAYRVIEDNIGQWLVQCQFNGHCWGLTHQNGVTMNGRPEDFGVIPKEEA